MPGVILNQPHGARQPTDDALLQLRLRDSRVCQSLLSAPWGIAVPESADAAAFIAVARGRCRVVVEDAIHPLSAGDFLLLPRGSAHSISDANGTPPLPPEALRWDSVQGRCVINAGGSGEGVHLVTGCLVFEVSPLLSALPTSLQLPREDRRDWQADIADLMCREALRPGPGSEVVLTQLVGLLSVGIIRRWLEQGVTDGFIRALNTPSIRKALDLMHTEPGHSWTLSGLAQAVGMSRSAFSQQFHDTVGEPPMRYWTRWRMSVARQWLQDGRYTVEEVADVLGYRSRAAFSRAFKSSTGQPPGRVRRARIQPLQTLNERIAGVP